MTAETAEDHWQASPLSVLLHSMNCLEGSSCQVPGCEDMRNGMGHFQYCESSNCPALPCMAMRQFSKESIVAAPPPSAKLSLEQIFRCAITATDMKPSLKRGKKTTAGKKCNTRSKTTSSSPSPDDFLFRVPKGRPRRSA